MTSRTACGTTRPMKPTLPATVTATAVAAAASTCSASVTPRTLTPSVAAVASPRASSVASRANSSAMASTATRASSARSPCGGTDRSPISQNSMPRTCVSGASDSISMMSAPNPAATTTPVSNSRVGDHAPGRAQDRRRAASTTRCAGKGGGRRRAPRTRAAAPPARRTAAPPDRPSTYGSASGLRSSTCISAPATASKPPTANAAIARGSRSSRTTDADASSPLPTSARTTFESAMSTLPTASATATRRDRRGGERRDDRGRRRGGARRGL